MDPEAYRCLPAREGDLGLGGTHSPRPTPLPGKRESPNPMVLGRGVHVLRGPLSSGLSGW